MYVRRTPVCHAGTMLYHVAVQHDVVGACGGPCTLHACVAMASMAAACLALYGCHASCTAMHGSLTRTRVQGGVCAQAGTEAEAEAAGMRRCSCAPGRSSCAGAAPPAWPSPASC